ncbi:MAG: glycerol-3-phosphate 1-O-acyltransferase PlsY [Clostridia bacterium]|nr:glycerol-3-phosphate 1-O-acyltransferase PlsY [Clostridia bacterium]
MELYTISIFLITYLICSISPAIEICKRVTGEDIRNLGSGNAGTTNAIRVMGRFWGSVVFVVDILKVFIAYGTVYLISIIFSKDAGFAFKSMFMVAAVFGHCYPIYYSFKGGKGIVVALICAYLVDSKIATVCLIAGMFIILLTRMVSLGSIGAIILFIIMTFVMIPDYILPVLIISAIIIFKHRSNIHRIVEGQENKLF